jgi:hypothetical protein
LGHGHRLEARPLNYQLSFPWLDGKQPQEFQDTQTSERLAVDLPAIAVQAMPHFMFARLFIALQRLLRRKRRFRDPQGFDYTISIGNGGADMAEKFSKWHGSALNNDILKHKKSDTLFILGSGPSINLITDEEWKHIAECDSIGFNRWMAHDFIPTYYCVQLVKSKALLNLLCSRSEAYKNVPYLIRGDHFANGKMQLGEDPTLDFFKTHELYYVREYPISSRCAINPQKLFRHAETLGMMKHGELGPMVPKWRSTIGMLMSWAYQMGYKKMILCGMDMQNNAHFWNDDAHAEMRAKYKLPAQVPSRSSKYKTNILAFTDEHISPNTVPIYIKGLAAWMKEKAGVETYVMKSQTILYPDLPLYSSSGQA